MGHLTAGVVTGRQKNAASGLALADDVARGWRREDAILADQQLFHSVCRANLGNELDDLGVPEAAIAANDEESTFDNAG